MAAARRPGRSRVIHDAFGMIPPPGPDDGPDAHVRYEVIVSVQSNGVGGDMCYGYRQDIQAEVAANLGAFGPQDVRFVPGFFADTLQPAGPVGVAQYRCRLV